MNEPTGDDSQQQSRIFRRPSDYDASRSVRVRRAIAGLYRLTPANVQRVLGIPALLAAADVMETGGELPPDPQDQKPGTVP